MERIAACVKNGIVENLIVMNDGTIEQVSSMYDHVEEVTAFPMRPHMGWTWTKSDGFRPVKPFPTWVFIDNEWVPPIPRPTDGKDYTWDEDTQQWFENDDANEWDSI